MAAFSLKRSMLVHAFFSMSTFAIFEPNIIPDVTSESRTMNSTYVVMAYIVNAYIVMAYVVMA